MSSRRPIFRPQEPIKARVAAPATRRSPFWSDRRTDVYRTDVPFGLPVTTLQARS